MRWMIAAVWLANGLFCKVLNCVPRHTQIVSRILGSEYARPLTIAIGFSEILMAAWIISGIKPRLNAFTQILLIAAMNTLEVVLAPDLLLWGRTNVFFAAIFIALIYHNESTREKRQNA